MQQFANSLRDLVVPPAVLAWLQSELLESDQTEAASRMQTMRRQQCDLERLQNRLDVLYEDRLDGRIDATMYDKKAADIREQQHQIRQKIKATEEAMLPPINQAVDLIALTSRAADLFVGQSGVEQRKLLHLVLQTVSWKGSELRMSLRAPFEELRLSSSASYRNNRPFLIGDSNFDDWR